MFKSIVFFPPFLFSLCFLFLVIVSFKFKQQKRKTKEKQTYATMLFLFTKLLSCYYFLHPTTRFLG